MMPDSKQRMDGPCAAAALRPSALALLTIAAVFLLICGCGKKGPPVPPKAADTKPVQDLKADVTGHRLRLSWAAASDSGAGPEAFTVYRAKIDPGRGDCPGCPLMFVRVGTVPADPAPVYEETLEPGYRYVYKVAARSRSGWQSESDPIELTH